MPRPEPSAIRKIVRSNFDRSVPTYLEFEERYGLFDFLARRLAKICGIGKGARILDIGCGTGVSTLMLAELVGEKGRIIGIDNSPKMMEWARRFAGEMENMEFHLCDACSVDELVDGKADAVLYNASIFLVPEPEKALGCAFNVLRDGGVVGMNYLHGVFDGSADEKKDAGDLFMMVKGEKKPFAPYGRSIFETAQLPAMLERAGFREVRDGIISRRMELEELRDFYSIPVQSAGLYPRTAYGERLKLLDSLLEHFGDIGNASFDQRWGWCTGVR